VELWPRQKSKPENLTVPDQVLRRKRFVVGEWFCLTPQVSCYNFFLIVAGIPRPKPCFLDNFDRWKVIDGRQTWRSDDGKRLYQWDSLHGEIEVYNHRGHHLGSVHAVNGVFLKQPVKGRHINV
jgi:hypothetical protein